MNSINVKFATSVFKTLRQSTHPIRRQILCIAVLSALGILISPTDANAVPVSYDFTGITTYASGVRYSSAGSSVTGTITIDFDAGVPSGTIGSMTDTWFETVSGGQRFSKPPVAGAVYSMALTSGEVSYSDSGIGSFGDESWVSGLASDNVFQAYHARYIDYVGETYAYDYSLFRLYGTSTQQPFDSQGFPAFDPLIMFGQVTVYSLALDGTSSVLDFTFTNISPAAVPLPSTAWLFGSGLIGFASFPRKRKIAQ